MIYNKPEVFMSDNKYLVWSFERNQWWAPNSLGYTNDATKAGRYFMEEAEKICKDANIGSMVNEDFVHVSDVKKMNELQNITKPFKKPAIEDLLKEFTQGYHQTNPLGKILDKLKENYHYPEDVHIPHVEYEATERLEIPMQNDNKKLVVSLYRMPSGSYECVLYTGQKNKADDIDPKMSKTTKLNR